MFIKEINGRKYGLIKVLDQSTGISFLPHEDDNSAWLWNDAGIRKRINMNLDPLECYMPDEPNS